MSSSSPCLLIKVKAGCDKVGSTVGRKLFLNVFTSLQFRSNLSVGYSCYFRYNKLVFSVEQWIKCS